ncbi:MAG: DNA topoisomerase 4 subunit A [Anaerolineae bacterium]|nr:DNA topoisomerase 4 subunit A [Anaerolineae bacterium]
MSAKRATSTRRRRSETAPDLVATRDSRRTIELAEELGYAYREYAHYTLLDRAIADVRDGFKPVHRRIVYAMGDMGLRATAQHRKSARVVGEVLGKYHPHGDQSVYDSLARMAQDFSLREVLIDGQGNFGSIDGDSPAAMRYTEVRLAPLGEEILRDIDMDTVDWQDNFDNSLKEPAVLPARFPNALVNGSSGIAVGFAANLAPHNLGEVCDAVKLMCDRWSKRDKLSVDDLMQVIPGPDFPTGGLAFRYRLDREGSEEVRSDAIRTAYETGSAGIVCQARMAVERQEASRSGEQIVITEIPYGQQKSTIIQRVATEARNGRVSGVTDIVDESDREGMRIVVQVSRQADPNDVLEMLVRRSTLRTTFGVNNLLLVPRQTDDGRITVPRVLSLKEMLECFVGHRLEVIRRRSQYELDRRRARLHIVQGLLIALDNIDEVIDTIRRSRTADTARNNLMRKFKLTEIQATAILDMQLRRLAAMERAKLKDEEKELMARIEYLEALLASETKQLGVIKDETDEIKGRYATPRRTKIVDAAPGEGEAPVTAAALAVPDAPQAVVLTTKGVLRSDASAYSYRVKDGVTSRAVEAHCQVFQAEPTDRVFLISTAGTVWVAPVGAVPAQASFADLGFKEEDAVLYGGRVTTDGYLVLGTVQGRVKRTELSVVAGMPDGEWSEIIGLEEGDKVLFAGTCGEGGQVVMATGARVLRVEADTISSQQTPSARGVIGIKLGKDDRLLGGTVLQDSKGAMAYIVTEKGFVKRVPIDEFAVKGRGTMGVLGLNQTSATGPIAAVGVGKATKSTVVDVLARDGKRQRMSLRSIPLENRPNRGRKGVKLAGVYCVIVWDE